MSLVSLSNGGSFATARRGGLTGEEIRQIEALRARERPVSWQNIAKRFGCSVEDVMASVGAIQTQRALPKLVAVEPPPPKKVPWSQDDIDLLSRLYGQIAAEDIAKVLSRTVSSVNQKAHHLGLTGLRGTNAHARAA